MIDEKDIYGSITQHIANAEQVSWNRFSNLLMSGSIFVLAWATIYVASETLPYRRLVLSAICTIGYFSGVFWAGLGYRGRKNVRMFLELGQKIELSPTHTPASLSAFGPCDHSITLCKKTPFRWMGSFWVLTIGSIVFALFYLFLLWVSLK